jgi:excisionase family DNA binding protein
MNEHLVTQQLTEIQEQLQNHIFDQKEIMNLQEAASFLCIAKSTLYKLTHKRSIPFHKPFGKKILFKRSELMSIIEGKPIQMYNGLPSKNEEASHE